MSTNEKSDDGSAPRLWGILLVAAAIIVLVVLRYSIHRWVLQ